MTCWVCCSLIDAAGQRPLMMSHFTTPSGLEFVKGQQRHKTFFHVSTFELIKCCSHWLHQAESLVQKKLSDCGVSVKLWKSESVCVSECLLFIQDCKLSERRLSVSVQCADIVLNCLFCRVYDLINSLPDSCESFINHCCPGVQHLISAVEPADSDDDDSLMAIDCGVFTSCHDASDCLELAMEISEICYHWNTKPSYFQGVPQESCCRSLLSLVSPTDTWPLLLPFCVESTCYTENTQLFTLSEKLQELCLNGVNVCVTVQRLGLLRR